MTAKPVVFLAFANDRELRARYLRNLPEEARRLRAMLEGAQRAGLCEVLVRQNVTLEELFAVFQSAEYRDRVAVFHYGGHANGYALDLEDTVAGLGRPTRWAWRSCSGTARIAAGVSQRLRHRGAGPGAAGCRGGGGAGHLPGDRRCGRAGFRQPLLCRLGRRGEPRAAYAEAKAAVIADASERERARGRAGALSTRHGAPPNAGPGSLLREGPSESLQWNLPEAAGDPLFGLPKHPAGRPAREPLSAPAALRAGPGRAVLRTR